MSGELSHAQKRALRAAGVNPTGVYVRTNPDAPIGAERTGVNAAVKEANERMRELSTRKAELIANFLRTDPEAAQVVADLAAAAKHRDVIRGRGLAYRVEVCRDGDWFTHVLAGGDSFAEAARRLTRGEADHG